MFFRITNDVQLRWFHYRIIHRILATNTLLYKIGIEDSDLCTFCKCNAETLSHLFWECYYVPILTSEFRWDIKNDQSWNTRINISQRNKWAHSDTRHARGEIKCLGRESIAGLLRQPSIMIMKCGVILCHC